MLVTMIMKIKDNSSYAKARFSEITALSKKLADKTLEQLEKEGVFVFPELIKNSDDLTKDQMVLQSLNDSFRTSNIMGCIGYGDKQLFIGSRFSNGENDFFLRYMLNRVLELPNIVDFEANADNNDETMFNILVFLFPKYLRLAMRKGLFKTYIRNQYNDENVKGTIDVSRHISQNTPFIGNVSYSQREYSFDNYMMELVRHTIEYIKKKPYGKNLIMKAKDEVNTVINATSDFEIHDKRRIIAQNQHTMVRHAYYREYRALQQLCLLILQNQNHRYGSGSNRLYGILFDGAWLWEEYINKLVGDYFYHPMNKSGQGAQRLFTDTNNIKQGLIYPDFISKNSMDRIIADAKYKPIDNIGNKDYLQLLAYMFRFDAHKGYYFYPKAENEDDLLLKLNKGTTYEKNVKPRESVLISKIGLGIPSNAECYSSFVSGIQKSENEISMIIAE